eukprot:comp22822_c2_seq3/m.35864 comp22822_c2_seq3/g.35864  ORF comp22822_c2_seq3/g.35864 comp22822_c2_seq3/m.35864 type:complete len:151 (-) comp22822_c2_seq3:10-462(-)
MELQEPPNANAELEVNTEKTTGGNKEGERGKGYKRSAEEEAIWEEDCVMITKLVESLDLDVVLDLIAVARLFLVPSMATICLSQAMRRMTPRCAAHAYETAVRQNHDDLRLRALETYMLHLPKLLQGGAHPTVDILNGIKMFLAHHLLHL